MLGVVVFKFFYGFSFNLEFLSIDYLVALLCEFFISMGFGDIREIGGFEG